MGKGDSPRPVDRKKYDKNFDKIDWSKYKCRCGHPKGTECLECPDLQLKEKKDV